jgi:hypothetical protein
VSQRQRDHVKEYARSLRLGKEKNLSDKVCHDCAASTAKEKFRLEPEEQAAVDAWLDEKYLERTKRDEPVVDFPLFNVPGAH